VTRATVATFNIRHGRGLDNQVELVRTAAAIERTGADLIALQELDRFNPRSARVDQPAELERLTGLKVHFCATVARDGWEYGIALAVRDPLGDLEIVDLPRLGTEEPRRALVAAWRGTTVVSTHLAHQPAANVAQQRALAGLAGRFGSKVIVLGDMNATARRFEAVARVGLRSAPAHRGTLHPWWRFKQIDHVLVGRAITVERTRTVPTRASDHLPLVVSLRSGVEDVLGVTYDA
jgi:endonuclease/exonuclease/phosphatase family metal-dependent hydrolase